MSSALVGYTGFVGGNLLAEHGFDDLYNSQNATQMRGHNYDLLVVSAAPAAKWIANREPQNDRRNIEVLIDNLLQVRAARAVLISTIDVYPSPAGVDERSPIDRGAQQPYGRHRLLLEDAFVDHFGQHLVLRLPGLFGPGLKKNAIFDLMHDHEVENIDPLSVFQFYDVRRLWDDIERCQAAGIELINMATEPLQMGFIAQSVFGLELPATESASQPKYDFRTHYDSVLGGRNGYLYSADEVLSDLKQFVKTEGGALP